MIRRTRTLAGLVGLAAMALSHGETLLASVCASAMDMSSQVAETADMSRMTHATMGMGAMEGMPMPSDDGSRDAGDRFDACPLGPALGQGCLALASLPGGAPRAADVPPDHIGRRSGDVVGLDLLISHTLFRPPRA
jgi:hypothetical protein